KAYSTFSVIAVVIAAIGLIGLTTFLMSKKLKEISVRKVFGSSTGALILLIYKDYMKVTITAVLLAWIAGYFWMDQWLSEFAFQINPHAGHFLIPATIMVSILLISTGLQIVKATQVNPVSNLKEN
ncbi:MAG: putative ABC transport system permease protein, partial [Planctomycetota bacterium]